MVQDDQYFEFEMEMNMPGGPMIPDFDTMDEEDK